MLNKGNVFKGLLAAILICLLGQFTFAQGPSRSALEGTLTAPTARVSSLPAEVPCAGTTILAEDFESGFPAGWLVVDGDGKTPRSGTGLQAGWQIRPDYKDTTKRIMASPSWYEDGGASNDWLILPGVTLGSNPCFSWATYSQDGAYPEAYEVRISLAGQDTSDFLSNPLVDTVLSESGNRTIHAIALDDYAGQSVTLAFRQISDDKFVLALDDVRISEIEPLDIGVSATDAPGGDPGDTLDVSIKVANYGSEVVTSFTVCWSIDGGTAQCMDVDSVSIEPNQAITITHDSTFVTDTLDSFYQLCAWTLQPNGAGDNDASNDTTCQQISVGSPVGIFSPESLEANVLVYPNPGRDIVRVQVDDLPAKTNLTLQVVDLQGRNLLQRSWRWTPGNREQSLDIHTLAPGLYLLVLQGENGMRTVRKLKVE